MSQHQSASSAISHLHTLHYSVAIVILLSILLSVYLISKKKNRKHSLSVKLIQKTKLTHDTYVFTFHLPPNRPRLGLKVGEHIEIEAFIDGKQVKRKYTPISRIDRKDTFQLLVKIYHKCDAFPEGGIMSQYLQSLEINDEILITLPYGRFNYLTKNKVKITTLDKQVIKKKFKNFFMVAGGTGITPIYQIIQYVTQNQHDVTPNLYLLFANRTQDDILLLNQLRNYQNQNPKLKIYFSVDRSIKTQTWTGMTGFIDEEKIATVIKKIKQDNQIQKTIFLSCGPAILSNIVEKIWTKSYAVKPENMFRF